MRLECLASAAAVAFLSTTAFAADLPTTRLPPPYVPPPVPVFSWTGFYGGPQIGYEFGASDAVAVSTATGGVLDAVNSKKNGLIGGGHGGYLFSTQSLGGLSGSNGRFGIGTAGVIGLEADVDGTSAGVNNFLPGSAVVDSVREGIQGSIRGRLGIAFDRVLLYGTGGVALGGFNIAEFAPSSDQFSQTQVGYTVGGGIEYAFTNTVSARLEYRYTDFGSFSKNLVNSTGGLVNITHRETNNRVQAGVSFKLEPFIAPAVVARY